VIYEKHLNDVSFDAIHNRNLGDIHTAKPDHQGTGWHGINGEAIRHILDAPEVRRANGNGPFEAWFWSH